MSNMLWNWLQKKWPHFSFKTHDLAHLEHEFTKNSGIVLGVLKHFGEKEKEEFLVEVLCNEAMKTSEIEGEYLDRSSVQSSIKRNLGLSIEKRKVSPAEYGISEMMVDLYLNYNNHLSNNLVFDWHKMICNGRRDLTNIGKYRSHEEPMQVVSGALGKEKVHYEAPPSSQVKKEMRDFVKWFNKFHFEKEKYSMLPLVKAGITHLYFVSIHPFEDGNGRIARALAEKSIAISIGQPSMISLSHTIEANKKDYYTALEENNSTLEITDWLLYIGQAIINAQLETLSRVDFIIEKSKFFDQFSAQLNERQMKVIQRLFEYGHTGFIGGLSAENYRKIAKTSESTVTRDLTDLVDKKILLKTGKLKGTRYSLNIGMKSN